MIPASISCGVHPASRPFARRDGLFAGVPGARVARPRPRHRGARSFQQRLNEQITSLRLPEGAFEALYDTELVAELRMSQLELAKVCKRLKKRGEDPREWLDVGGKNTLLKENLDLLEGRLGMRRLEQRRLLEESPTVVTQYDTDDFGVRLGVYESLGFSGTQVKRMFVAYPECLGDYFMHRIQPALEYYLHLGLHREQVVEVFEKIPSMLGGDFYKTLDDKIQWLQGTVELPRSAIVQDWLVKKPRQVFKACLAKMEENYKVFRDAGFSVEECSSIFFCYPELLSGDKLDYQDKINLLKNHMEGEFKQVVVWPEFFTYSYHRRITMRIAFMEHKGKPLEASRLRTVLTSGTNRFMKKIARSNKREFNLFTKEWKAALRNRESRQRRLELTKYSDVDGNMSNMVEACLVRYEHSNPKYRIHGSQ